MNDSKRDLRKPIPYCCEQMEVELSRGDIIDYIWYTREYIIRSSTTPEVFIDVDFCPWCGKDVGKYSVYDEYWEAYDKADQEDPTLPEDQCDPELEGFQEKFLREWEAENETENIIFDNTLPEGHCVRPLRFLYNSTKKTELVRDNKQQKLKVVTLKDEEGQVLLEGLVVPERDPERATRADFYMPKGKGREWGYVGDMSLHTGIVRKPTDESKFQRSATVKPMKGNSNEIK